MILGESERRVKNDGEKLQFMRFHEVSTNTRQADPHVSWCLKRRQAKLPALKLLKVKRG
jgi:hypothetical protein